MSLHFKLRAIHRKLAPWILPFLLFSTVTGLAYRIGRSWFNMPKGTGSKILFLHSGEWLGVNGSVIYLAVLGGALLFLIFSGLWMWFAGKSAREAPRKLHRILAISFSLPLIVTAVTGMAYQACGKWFHADESTLKILMSLHQGSWLGPTLRPFYILLLGGGLIILCLTGLRMLPRRKS